jgi:hypothetical protein
MHDLVEKLRDRYDVIIFDAPPLLPVTDAALLAAQTDGALMVVRHSRTTREQLRSAQERLWNVGAHTLGVVFNMVPKKRGGWLRVRLRLCARNRRTQRPGDLASCQADPLPYVGGSAVAGEAAEDLIGGLVPGEGARALIPGLDPGADRYAGSNSRSHFGWGPRTTGNRAALRRTHDVMGRGVLKDQTEIWGRSGTPAKDDLHAPASDKPPPGRGDDSCRRGVADCRDGCGGTRGGGDLDRSYGAREAPRPPSWRSHGTRPRSPHRTGAELRHRVLHRHDPGSSHHTAGGVHVCGGSNDVSHA